jgi:4-hydroxybenzoate polyprenyltransferase
MFFIMQPYLQLIRLPLLPSALGNICLGAISAGISQDDAMSFILLLFSSAFLYASGMAWNDYFDAKIDAIERPERPIPSGKISLKNAAIFATMLMTLGIGFALLVELLRGFSGTTFTIALAVAFFILAYDAGGKNFIIGPILMGSCRFLNVLLGWSVVGQPYTEIAYLQAGIIGVYIVGVTWYARNEAEQSNRISLVAASMVIISALFIGLIFPTFKHQENETTWLYPYLFFLLMARLTKALLKGIQDPTPKNVQLGVVTCLKSLILLDCILTIGIAGWAGLWILVLLAPSLLMNRFKKLYST